MMLCVRPFLRLKFFSAGNLIKPGIYFLCTKGFYGNFATASIFVVDNFLDVVSFISHNCWVDPMTLGKLFFCLRVYSYFEYRQLCGRRPDVGITLNFFSYEYHTKMLNK